MELTPESVAPLLEAHRIVPAGTPVAVRALGGGVSNTVLGASWRGDAVVLKQPLAKLRVAADWPFDCARVLVERDCLVELAQLVPGAVPLVRLWDPDALILGIDHVPVGAILWKTSLLKGDVDLATARMAGELLGRVHARAKRDERIRERFWDQTVLIQGRIDPFHRTVARAHPLLASLIENEVERLLATRVTLTLGDYSPKNLFTYADGLIAIDFETAHWGDPAFDAAFCITHLVLKSCRGPRFGERYLRAASVFWDAYRAAGVAECGEQAVAREIGCLLLARIDGKSPVEYLTETATQHHVRDLAATVLQRANSVADVLHLAGAEVTTPPATEAHR